MATASEPDPAEPEPVTVSWAWADCLLFRPYAVPTSPSVVPARTTEMVKRQSTLMFLAELIINNRFCSERCKFKLVSVRDLLLSQSPTRVSLF